MKRFAIVVAAVFVSCTDEKLIPVERQVDLNLDPCAIWTGSVWVNPRGGAVIATGDLVNVCRSPGPDSFEEATGNDAGAPPLTIPSVPNGGTAPGPDIGGSAAFDAGVVVPPLTIPNVPTGIQPPGDVTVLPPIPDLPDYCTAVQVCVTGTSVLKCAFDQDAKKECQEACKSVQGQGRGQCQQDCIRANRFCSTETKCKEYGYTFVCQ